MSAQTDTAPAAAAAAPPAKSKKKIFIAAGLVVAVAAAYFLVIKPKGAESDEPKPLEPGVLLEMAPITTNLADGHLIKVGLSVQLAVSEEGGHGEPSGAGALDDAISFFGKKTMAELVAPGGRDKAKVELTEKVAHRYHEQHLEVMEVLFTEFVVQ